MIFREHYKSKYTEIGSWKTGSLTIDIILALTLATIFIAVTASLSTGSQEIFEQAQARDEALKLYEAGDYTSSTKLYGNDMFQTDIEVASSTLRFVSVSARQANSQNVFQLSDASYAIGTPLCSVDFSASTPIIKLINLPIDPLLPLTDIEVRNGVFYIGADSSTASDPDFLIIDAKDQDNPSIISQINTGPGISSIALAGKRIFASAPSTASELHVIRMDSLQNLVLEKKYRLPLPYATATPALGSAIFFNDNKVYLGTEKWDGDEFNIIDVIDPANPVWLSGMETNSKVNDIFVRDGIAYIAASDEKQLRVVDVHDPANPVLLNSLSPSGWQRQEGKNISLFEDGLKFGRTSGGFNLTSDHELFSWPTNSSTTLASPTSTDIRGGVYGIVADRSRSFIITREVDRELQIFDIPRSDLGIPRSDLEAYSLPILPKTITCDRNHLYILAANAPVVYEITY